jgi:hypothetical protein
MLRLYDVNDLIADHRMFIKVLRICGTNYLIADHRTMSKVLMYFAPMM